MKKLLITIFLIVGCSTNGVDRADQHKITTVFYASIQSVKKIKLSSQVNEGIVGGGIVGFIDELDGNTEDMIAGFIGGAIIGGLVTAIFEGSNTAYEYSLYSIEQGHFTYIQKTLIDTNTACVGVRISGQSTITTAPTDRCNGLDSSHSI